MDKLEVYGKPSEELQKVITNFSVQTYNHFVDSVMNSYFIT
jgi:hypothetical protein